jgi:hypothetical protein
MNPAPPVTRARMAADATTAAWDEAARDGGPAWFV